MPPRPLTEIIHVRTAAARGGLTPADAMPGGDGWPGCDGGAVPHLAVVIRRECDGTARVWCWGEIDVASAGGLTDGLLTALGGPSRPAVVVVDLGGVTFCDAAGITALLTGREQAHTHGVGWRVLGAHGAVARVLDMAGVVGWLAAGAPGPLNHHDRMMACAGPGGLHDARRRNDATYPYPHPHPYCHRPPPAGRTRLPPVGEVNGRGNRPRR